ncbi:MAG: gliding motility lipoprotein GldH [Luteibaculum sp.]
METGKGLIHSVLGLCLFALFSCGPRVKYSEVYDIDPDGWKIKDTLSFSLEVEDTTKPYNYFVAIKNTKEYQYSNFILFMEAYGPNGLKAKDTLHFTMAYPDGRWTGKSFGAEVSNKFLIKKGAPFPHPGTYGFVFYHAMRDSSVENITNLGLIIEELP